MSTILYLVSLQDLTNCPFRVVDEINQGLFGFTLSVLCLSTLYFLPFLRTLYIVSCCLSRNGPDKRKEDVPAVSQSSQPTQYTPVTLLHF